MSYVFLFTFFRLPLIFTLVSIFHFLATATKFSCCSSNKKCRLFFALALAFCRSFSRRPSLVCHPFSLSLSLSLSPFFKFVDMTINLSNTYWNNFRFPLSSLLTLKLSLLYKTRVAMRFHKNNLELHLRCHTRLWSYFTLVCLLLLRTDGRKYGHVITKISRMNRLPHFLRYMGLHKGARLELRYEKRNVYRLLGRLIWLYSHLEVLYQTFSSVLPLKALQVALHFSRIGLISSTQTRDFDIWSD